MICPIDRRLASMDEVITRLQSIEDWEQNARLLPISKDALSSVERLQRQAMETKRVAEENISAREQERKTLEDVKRTFVDWLNAELKKTAAHISEGGVLHCSVGDVTFPNNHDWRAAYTHNRMYSPFAGLELQLEEPGDNRQHILQIRLCADPGPVVTVTVSVGPQKKAPPQSIPVRDASLAMIPYYRQTVPHHPATASSIMGFLSKSDWIGTTRGHLNPTQPHLRQRWPAVTQSRVEGVTRSFNADATQHTKFKASEWPSNVEVLREALARAVSAFIEYVESGAQELSL